MKTRSEVGRGRAEARVVQVMGELLASTSSVSQAGLPAFT